MTVRLPAAELQRRLDELRQRMRRERIGAAYLTSPAAVRYYSGFTGSDSALLVTAKGRTLLTDSRYREEAARSAPGAECLLWRDSIGATAGRQAAARGAKRLAFEENRIDLASHGALRRSARGVRLVAWSKSIHEPRQVKSAWEIRRIERALRVAEAAFRDLRRSIRPGLTERDLAAELEYRMRRRGADGAAFPSIIAADGNASLPHAHPGSRRLRAGGLVLIDWGACVDGYNSDLTRTLFLGSIPRLWQSRYEAVLEAQSVGLQALAVGVSGARADAAAREALQGRRLGKRFSHGLGHGAGLEVHEGPALSRRNRLPLAAGAVVTVEPGVYFPGRGGIRIEDMALVTETGARLLSRLPKDLAGAMI